jgi:hypothetical protein
MKTIRTLIFFITLASCFFLTGLILVGTELFNFESTGKYHLIFGLTAIIFFTILKFWRFSDFIYLGLLISMFIVFVWSRDDSLLVIIRNSLWFITIGIFTFLSYKILQTANPRKFKLIPLVVWIVSFSLIFFVMLMFNIFVFNVYKVEGDLTFVFYLKQSLRFGVIYGLGIGLGYILADFIIEKLKSSEN